MRKNGKFNAGVHHDGTNNFATLFSVCVLRTGNMAGQQSIGVVCRETMPVDINYTRA
jgi:hypothetical protein